MDSWEVENPISKWEILFLNEISHFEMGSPIYLLDFSFTRIHLFDPFSIFQEISIFTYRGAHQHLKIWQQNRNESTPKSTPICPRAEVLDWLALPPRANGCRQCQNSSPRCSFPGQMNHHTKTDILIPPFKVYHDMRIEAAYASYIKLIFFAIIELNFVSPWLHIIS